MSQSLQDNFTRNTGVRNLLSAPGRLLITLALAVLPGIYAGLSAEEGEKLLLGTVRFPTSASGGAQKEFETGVLALHSFWYEEARDRFRRAMKLDPAFAMAYWGMAMTYDNAFRTEPGTDYEQKGLEVVRRFRELERQGKLKLTERESDYLEAVRLRFRPEWDVLTRRREYGQAMDRLVQKYPDDDEAKIFAALALMSYPAFDREMDVHVVAAAAPLEELFMYKRDHPGVLHYLIHAYDSQTFAPLGLRQARLYAKIAPDSSHALHMPSHIFRHLGMWEEVVASNEASYRVSAEWQERTGRPLRMRDYHSLDWLLDAYLRLGRMDEAGKIMGELDKIEKEMRQRGEDPGEFASLARSMRMAYQRAVSP